MCYSKEVQLITGSSIVGFSSYYWYYFTQKFQQLKKNYLLPFLYNTVTGFALIGGHQLFEFLSLVTQSQVIYKVGLILSVFGMFFGLRAIEKLYNRSFYSQFFLLAILASALHMFSINMHFEAHSFFLRHHDIMIWGMVWLVMFFYAHFCAFGEIQILKKSLTHLKLAVIFLCFSDLSFLLSLAYTIFGYYYLKFSVCTDLPSIWCTFAVIQAIVLPISLGYILPKLSKPPKQHTKLPLTKALIYLFASIITLAVFIIAFPFFRCVIVKLAFP